LEPQKAKDGVEGGAESAAAEQAVVHGFTFPATDQKQSYLRMKCKNYHQNIATYMALSRRSSMFV
jgi:hypothetical protein